MNKNGDSLVFVQAQNLQGIIYVSSNEGPGAFVFHLFDVMYIQMYLCEVFLLAKVRSELCFEIFIIKDATCFLTVPPYSAKKLSGSPFPVIGTNMGRHFHRQSEVIRYPADNGVTEPKAIQRDIHRMRKAILRKYVTICEGRWLELWIKRTDSLLHYSEVHDLRKWKSGKTAKVDHSRFSLCGLLKVEEGLHFDFHSDAVIVGLLQEVLQLPRQST
ncbi:hypothetical protein Tco_0694589 [Tanacetum coccineum]